MANYYGLFNLWRSSYNREKTNGERYQENIRRENEAKRAFDSNGKIRFDQTGELEAGEDIMIGDLIVADLIYKEEVYVVQRVGKKKLTAYSINGMVKRFPVKYIKPFKRNNKISTEECKVYRITGRST